jgi:hypothetical protein
MIKTKHLKLEFYRWLKRLCIDWQWDRGYLFFATLVFKEIEKVYGPQSDHAW